MMAVELCGASPAFAHPYTNEEQDHAMVSTTRRRSRFGQSTRGNDLTDRA
jgi:hypothetical protein